MYSTPISQRWSSSPYSSRYSSPLSELKCFDHELYTFLSDYDLNSIQCIAPTVRKTRCKWTIDQADLDEASAWMQEARYLPPGEDQDEALRRFVLLHCCDRCHRHKLDADETGCAQQIVRRYSSRLATSAGQADGVAGRRLRSRMVILPREKPKYFVRYKSDPRDTLRSTLFQDIMFDSPESGSVYVFSWPAYPEYLKIGYTASTSALDRVSQWRNCHPDPVLIKSVYVPYPERMERLLHLQLAEHRYRIAICATCLRSHEEWFQLPAELICQVMDDWNRLTMKEALYDSSGRLTLKWCNRLRKHTGDITARALIAILDAEAADLAGQSMADLARKEAAELAQEAAELAREKAELKRRLAAELAQQAVELAREKVELEQRKAVVLAQQAADLAREKVELEQRKAVLLAKQAAELARVKAELEAELEQRKADKLAREKAELLQVEAAALAQEAAELAREKAELEAELSRRQADKLARQKAAELAQQETASQMLSFFNDFMTLISQEYQKPLDAPTAQKDALIISVPVTDQAPVPVLAVAS